MDTGSPLPSESSFTSKKVKRLLEEYSKVKGDLPRIDQASISGILSLLSVPNEPAQVKENCLHLLAQCALNPDNSTALMAELEKRDASFDEYIAELGDLESISAEGQVEAPFYYLLLLMYRLSQYNLDGAGILALFNGSIPLAVTALSALLHRTGTNMIRDIGIPMPLSQDQGTERAVQMHPPEVSESLRLVRAALRSLIGLTCPETYFGSAQPHGIPGSHPVRSDYQFA
ncbi:hypothetical protein PAPYR_1635 [Paratrimastix pyriformis]|uniref:Uncharacterized protein n=1 Tax=Paratrimastix pyriformis TaxID=342808 RepID=A0ABQ8US30_9EUKA|nr:hypothetical protein PAPYR_1635 [Paratrimastix pyriformis]